MSDKQPEPDLLLKFATVDEIVEELGRRHSSVLLVAEWETKNDERTQTHCTWHRGGWAAALGLSIFATNQLMEAKVDKDTGNNE